MPETDLSQTPFDSPGLLNTALGDFEDEPAAPRAASGFAPPVASAFRRTRMPLESLDEHDDTAEGDDDPEPPARRREGLPPSYRMRHEPHYVEQLIGEAPLQTVQQIPVAQVESDGRSGAELGALAESIRRFGMLQPLVVTRRPDASGYRVIAGANRLAAAALAGVATVPCLVVEADDELVAALGCRVQRTLPALDAAGEPASAALAAVAESAATPPPAADPSVAAEPFTLEPPLANDAPGAAAFREMSRLAAGLAALAPLANGADADGFCGPVLRDLMVAESDRTATFAAAAAMLADPQAPPLEAVDCATVLARVREKVEGGARLKGVTIEWPATATVPAKGSVASLVTAWSSLLYGQLAAASAGDRIVISLDAPRVRPAVVFTATLHSTRGARDVRPAGVARDVMLRAAEHAARQHGGRVGQESSADGARAVFVLPL